MKVRWTTVAEQDRLQIVEHIAEEDPRAAVRMDELFGDAAARLTNFPNMGRPGKIAGTRELIPHQNYRLVYQVEGDTVWILALIHTARMWPLLAVKRNN